MYITSRWSVTIYLSGIVKSSDTGFCNRGVLRLNEPSAVKSKVISERSILEQQPRTHIEAAKAARRRNRAFRLDMNLRRTRMRLRHLWPLGATWIISTRVVVTVCCARCGVRFLRERIPRLRRKRRIAITVETESRLLHLVAQNGVSAGIAVLPIMIATTEEIIIGRT